MLSENFWKLDVSRIEEVLQISGSYFVSVSGIFLKTNIDKFYKSFLISINEKVNIYDFNAF